ncbi:MAG: hypothetical protein ABL955_07635, partial [Elusimicrobiota bacterium]
HILVFALLFCSLEKASALQKANTQDYRDIADQINKKNSAEAAITKNRMDWDAATPEEKTSLDSALTRLNRDRKAAYEQAMWLTMRAYDIIPFADNEPILDDGVSVLRSPENGKHITWIPIFDDVGPKPDQDEFGRNPGIRKVGPNIAGNTASDGVSRIFPGAFNSPAELASILVHEQLHVRQNTTPGMGDTMTTAELEVEAYEEEERLLHDDVLGYSKDAIARQKKRLTEALDGKDGKPGKRALAKAERAAADKHNGGKPLPERSLASHAEDEIKRLVSEARQQIIIAQRDHDERLRNTFVDLTRRSCSAPGSVTQAELDGLPQPFGGDFNSTSPQGPDICNMLVYRSLVKTRSAKSARDLSTPTPVQVPAQPLQQPTSAAPIISQTPFSTVLPGLRDHAVYACSSSNEVPIDSNLTNPHNPFAFWKEMDDKTANKLAAGLGDCESRLFRRLIQVIRDGYGNRISSGWIKETVAEYRPQPNPSSGNTPRQRSEEPLNHGCPVDGNGIRGCPAGW